MAPHRLIPLTIAGCFALAGCGAGDDADGGDLASKPPEQILADMSAELAKVRSYHVEGTQDDEDGHSTLAADVTAGGAARLAVNNAGKRFDLVLAGGRSYMRANRAFWSAQGGPNGAKLARLLGDRWVIAPPSTSGSLNALLKELAPRTLARCAAKDHGTITHAGTATVAGQDAVMLADKGERPGTSPGLLSVAAKGRPLPLRVTQTGPDKPGGKPDPSCGNDGSSTTKASDLRFSRFDAPLRIAAPRKALDLGALQQGGGSSATQS